MNNVVIFKLTANPSLADEVCRILGVPLAKSEVHHFADGEVLARPLESVRGKTVYIIQSTATPVAERIMELLVFINGLKNAKAKEIILVCPYYGFSRQDRIARAGEPISAKLVANLYENAGVNHIITMDLHTPQIQGFFSCPVDDLSSISLFGEYYRNWLKANDISTDNVAVVSPDHGSLHRARDLASEIPNSTLAIIDKRRPAPNTAEVMNVIGHVKGKVCIIIDDIIDTAGTVIASTKALYEKGAAKVLIGGTHGVLSGDAEDRLFQSGVADVVITNSIERKSERLHVISIAPMIAGIIEATETGKEVPDSWMNFY